eukprot:GFUD01032797.1.p1 GENE.GFUD01032797.1~~GFUD01032797.1.p1  ORF type:complete len:317 (+),score=56.26 GFUD01032797.1:31-981(+)
MEESVGTSFYDCLQVDWKHGHEKEYFWISGVVLAMVATIGLVGNMFTMVVLCQPQMRNRVFYNLLFALACFDTLFILSYGIRVSYQSLACYPFNKLVGSLTYPLLNIGLTGSIYMTVAISLERYLGICHPNLVFKRKAWVFILPVLIINISFNFPRFFEQKFTFVNGSLVGEYQAWRKNEAYMLAYNLWASIIVGTVIPLGMLIYLNGAIIARIIRTSKTVTEMGKTHQKNGRNTTKILFWIVLIFFVLHTPRIVYKSVFYMGSEDRSDWYGIRPVARLALIINSSSNFIIYCLVGKNFQKEFLKVFRLQKICSRT